MTKRKIESVYLVHPLWLHGQYWTQLVNNDNTTLSGTDTGELQVKERVGQNGERVWYIPASNIKQYSYGKNEK